MKAWMRSALAAFGLAPRPRPASPRRSPRMDRPGARSAFEALERREVLSATVPAPFASLPVQVSSSGKPATVVVHFEPGQVASDRASSVLLGFYATPAAGTTSNPVITEVDGPLGRQFRANLPNKGTTATQKALFITAVNTSPAKPVDITVDLSSADGKAGSYVLQAFLPGDTDGNGVVNAVDLDHVQAIYGAATGQANFDPAADFNLDGHVGCVDRRLTQLNLGAQVSYTPANFQTAAVPVVTTPAVPVVTTPAVPVVTTSIEPAPVTTAVVPVPSTATTTPVATAPVVTIPVRPVPVVTPTVATVPATTTTTTVPVVTQATTTVPVTTQATTTVPVTTQATTTVPVVTQATTATTPVFAVAPASAALQAGGPTTAAVVTAPSTSVAYVPVTMVNPGAAQPAGSASVYYGGPVYQGTAPASSDPNAPMVPVYYYPIPAQATAAAAGGAYYYGQPVVQAPVLTPGRA